MAGSDEPQQKVNDMPDTRYIHVIRTRLTSHEHYRLGLMAKYLNASKASITREALLRYARDLDAEQNAGIELAVELIDARGE